MRTCLADACLEGKRMLRMFLSYACALTARYKMKPSPKKREKWLFFRNSGRLNRSGRYSCRMLFFAFAKVGTLNDDSAAAAPPWVLEGPFLQMGTACALSQSLTKQYSGYITLKQSM